jgi:hypothetical protein
MHTHTPDVQALNKPAPRNQVNAFVARDENESLMTASQAHDLFLLRDGVLINRVMRGRRGMPGMIAGSPNGLGYLCIKVNYVKYRVHRVVWLMTYGQWPVGQIDHINGVKDDNRIENLREVTAQENQRNSHIRVDNVTGVTGVTRDGGCWRARIKVDGKKICLGYYKSFDDAVSARRRGEEQFGFHPNHGRTDSARRNGLPALNAPRTLRTA